MKIVVIMVNTLVICIGIIGLTDLDYLRAQLLQSNIMGSLIFFGIPIVNLIYVYYNSRVINELNLQIKKEKFWKEKMK